LFDLQFRKLLVAYLAARSGEAELARDAVRAAGAPVEGFTALEDLRAIVDAELARNSGDAPRAVQLLKARINGAELFLTHVALLEALADSNDLRGALAEAQWLAHHRGRAYSEYNSRWILRPFYVGQSGLALLRAADLQVRLEDHRAAAASLTAFRTAWSRGTRSNATRLRLEALDAIVGTPRNNPATAR
jgi:hypothetical protein